MDNKNVNKNVICENVVNNVSEANKQDIEYSMDYNDDSETKNIIAKDHNDEKSDYEVLDVNCSQKARENSLITNNFYDKMHQNKVMTSINMSDLPNNNLVSFSKDVCSDNLKMSYVSLENEQNNPIMNDTKEFLEHIFVVLEKDNFVNKEAIISKNSENIQNNSNSSKEYSLDNNEFELNSNIDMQVNIHSDIQMKVKSNYSKPIMTSVDKQTDIENFNSNNQITEKTDEPETSVETNQYYRLINNYFDDKIIELSRLNRKEDINKQNYFRGCKWSPDGTCILSVVNNGGMQLTELPSDLYANENVSSDRPVNILSPSLLIKEAGLVYDFVWYPKMNSYDPVTCCWITSIKHGPVQLWDAFNGSLRSSYRGYNEVDEVEAALCTHFSPDGNNIYAGYKKSIKLFDTDRPGRDYLNFRIKQPASCMTLNSTGDLIAIGSWNRTITLMCVNSGELHQFDTIYGHKGGITHLKFMDDPSTSSTNYLFSGARMDPTLFMWDIRQTSKPVQTFCRQVMSNQRIYFDLSPYFNKWLISASTSGILRVWDLYGDKEFKFSVHSDCCNGVSFHPSRPIIATSSGQHHFVDDSDECENVSYNKNIDKVHKKVEKSTENAMVFWWIGSIINEEFLSNETV